MQVGDRVGAIRNADDEMVYMYGYGTYQGEEIPPKGTVGAFGIDLGEVGIRNPKILLDDGSVVWGCQCWWGPENKIRAFIGSRQVKYVAVYAGEGD